MSESYAPPPPPRKPRFVPTALYKQRSWSPDASREEAWQRQKGRSKKGRSRSVTAEDLDELKACLELGFEFDSSELDTRLTNTLPALELYHAVNKSYSDSISKSTATTAVSSPDRDSVNSPSPLGSPLAILGSSGSLQFHALFLFIFNCRNESNRICLMEMNRKKSTGGEDKAPTVGSSGGLFGQKLLNLSPVRLILN